MSKLGTNVVTQIGIVVKDVEKTAKAYADLFGMEVPNWSITDTVDKAQTKYLGNSTQARAKLAFLHMGSVDIELIEPVDGPSTWKEFLDTHGEGVHHIAFVIDGMNEITQTLQTMNMPLVQRGEYEGGRYAYIDSTDALKVIIELLENDR